MPPNSLKRIRKVSNVFCWLARLGLVALASLAIWTLARPDWVAETARLSTQGPTTLGPNTQLALQLTLLIALIAPAYTLLQINNLFSFFGQGKIFGIDPADAIRRIGIGLLIMSIFSVASRTAFVVILTFNNPPGQRALSINLSSDSYGFVLFGGLFITLGWVLGEAAKLSEENRQFV